MKDASRHNTKAHTTLGDTYRVRPKTKKVKKMQKWFPTAAQAKAWKELRMMGVSNKKATAWVKKNVTPSGRIKRKR